MSRYFFALVVVTAAFLSPVRSFATQEVIVCETVIDLLPLIDEKTWFLVDLDNTVFQATQALGHVNWLQHEVQKQMNEGKSREEAFYSLYPLWKKTQMMTDVTPIEVNFLKIIQQLQNNNIVVMGLTQRQLFVIPETLRQLDSLGVTFQKTAPLKETINFFGKEPALYTQGILFIGDFNTKGDIFRTFLKQLEQKPKKIVFIDDKRENVEELAKVAMLEEIEYIGAHYTAIERGQQIYFPELAEYQLNFFDNIMSNEEALLFLSQANENQEVSMKQHHTCPEYLYKVISKKQWQASLLKNEVVLSSIDNDFIHLAKEAQVDHVIQKYWNGMDCIVLKLTSKKLIGRLIDEKNPGGTSLYYHLYEGKIPFEAVQGVTIIDIPRNQHRESL